MRATKGRKMASINIVIPDRVGIKESEKQEFKEFMQKMANRYAVGHMRYGTPKTTSAYMTRLSKELATYKKTGNKEQLFNIANYAFLESYAPENVKAHLDETVESVTRTKRTAAAIQ